jgi:predicted methyltransferase
MSNRPPPLTQRAHTWLASVLRPGDLAIDATVGNGHDTRFLAQQVGPMGRVIGFELQPAALEVTRQRLAAEALDTRVTLYCAGHEHLLEYLPEAVGQVAAVTFNLGYLPGSDKSVVTRAQTTEAALTAAWQALRPGGLITVLAYVGHPGGADELAAVEAWLDALPPPRPEVHRERGPSLASPVLLVLRRPT